MKENELKIIGIAGGGQLAQMMISPAKKLGKHIYVLDPNDNCSASKACHKLIKGDFDNAQDLSRFSEIVDVLTFDIEKVNVECLQELESQNTVIRPQASVMGIIQDKFVQKKSLQKMGFPVGRFSDINDIGDLDYTFPLIWKARRGGYDGMGVVKISSQAQLSSLNTCPGYIEAMVDLDKELAIMVARDIFGNVETLPVTEIFMDKDTNALKLCKAPAQIESEIKARIESIAKSLVEKLKYVGVLGIEFFLTAEGEILINELSPRPHNSGHFTIEACSVSQFEQHIRAVSGLNVLPCKLLFNSVCFNVFASEYQSKTNEIIKLLNSKSSEMIFKHDYLKRGDNRAGRKIGHVTVLGDTLEIAEKIANRLINEFS